ncbi:MAG: Ig-like domain-containing protein [Gemmatimonadaceae bacterium]
MTTVNVSILAPQLVVGDSSIASAILLDAHGDTVTDRSPGWSSLTPMVASVSSLGVVIGLQAGLATVRATSGAATGDVQVLVKNPTAATVTLARDTATLVLPGGSTQLIATARDTAGKLIQNPVIAWQSSAPLVASVNSTGLVTGIAAGAANITATVDAASVSAAIQVTLTPGPNAPLIVSVDPEPLRPGGTFTLAGNNFAPTAAGNVVLVDGVKVLVNGPTTINAISITLPNSFPCAPTHPVFIEVTANGSTGGGPSTLQVANPRTLAVGQSVVITDPSQVRCNEIDSTGGRYAVSVYNAYRATVSPGSTGAVALTVTGAVPTTFSAAVMPRRPPVPAARVRALPTFGGPQFEAAQRTARARNAIQRHMQLLEQNMEYVRAHAGAIRANVTSPRAQQRATISAQVSTVGEITSVKVPNLNAANFCNTNTPINVRTVFVGAHSIIVEDTTTVFDGVPTLAGQMDSVYVQLGQEFESVMYPIDLTNFGDPLAMDASLGGLGKIVMAFSPRVNSTSEGSILGFVVSCDFFKQGAPSSNDGEYLYAGVPTSMAQGYANSGTLDSWRRDIRPTIVHEVKHIAAYAARIMNGLALEDLSWEEGMARNAEELYARTFYNNALAKQNIGYAASIGCDIQFNGGPPPCGDRPDLMLRHFDALYSYLQSPASVSMLGPAVAQDFTFYASAWSVERWANDIFSASESQFFKDWTTSNVTGVANLEARTGQPWEQSLGEWSLAMYSGSIPGFIPTSSHLRFPSWNLADIWQGMHADLGSAYPAPNPFNPHVEAYGNFSVNLPALQGGGFTIFDLSGTQPAKQLIQLQSVNGGDPPSTVRIAIVRIQ